VLTKRINVKDMPLQSHGIQMTCVKEIKKKWRKIQEKNPLKIAFLPIKSCFGQTKVTSFGRLLVNPLADLRLA